MLYIRKTYKIKTSVSCLYGNYSQLRDKRNCVYFHYIYCIGIKIIMRFRNYNKPHTIYDGALVGGINHLLCQFYRN